MINISLISFFASKNSYLEANKSFKIIEDFLAIDKSSNRKHIKAAIVALQYLRDNKVLFKEK